MEHSHNRLKRWDFLVDYQRLAMKLYLMIGGMAMETEVLVSHWMADAYDQPQGLPLSLREVFSEERGADGVGVSRSRSPAE